MAGIQKTISKGIAYLKKRGIRKTIRKTALHIDRKRLEHLYVRRMMPTEDELTAQRQEIFTHPVGFSVIVPLYNTPMNLLRETVDSVLKQSYGNWQLCLADGSDEDHDEVGAWCRERMAEDRRILYRKLEKNQGISGNTNAALTMATGEYAALFDHDDLLMPNALYEMAKAIEKTDADFLYSDELIFASPKVNLQGTSGSCGWESALISAIGQDPDKNPPFKKSFFCDGDASSESASAGGSKKSYSLNNLKQAIHPYIPDTLGAKGVIGKGKNSNMGYISGNKTTSVYTASDLIIIGECPTEGNTVNWSQKTGNAKFSASDAASNSGTASAIHQQICIKPKRYTTHSTAGELFLDGHAKHMRPQQTLPSKAKDDGKTQIDSNFFIENKTSYSDGTKKLASTAWGSWTDCPNRKIGTDCEGESAGTCRRK